MNLQEWNGLTANEQEVLASKYGLTRSGNNVVAETELTKIPEVKKDVKETIKKLGAKKPVKLGNARRGVRKSK